MSSLCFVLLHCPHLTFFTSERPTLPPAYLYHKDKRVLPRNLQSTFTRVTCLSETGGWPLVHRRQRDACRRDARQTVLSVSENESSVLCWNCKRLLVCGPNRPEGEKEKKSRRRRWVHPVTWTAYFGLFLKIWEQAKRSIFNCFTMSVDPWRNMGDNWVFCTRRSTNMRESVPFRERERK